MNRRWIRLATALAGAAATAVVLAGTSGATHIGPLDLGHPNTAIAQTSLTANLTDPVLRVINQGSAAAFRGDAQSGVGVNGTSVTGPGQQGQSQAGIGMLGLHSNNTGVNPGVQGQTNSTDPNAAGVVGRDLVGPGKGVLGRAVGAGSAIFGDNVDPTGWAGNFAGNVRVTGNEHFGATTRQMLNLYDQAYAIGVQDWTLYNRTDGNFAWYRGGSHSNAQLDPGPFGTTLMSLTPTGLTLPGNESLAVGKGLRVEGPASPGGSAVSVGGNGDVAVDAPGIVGGRFIVTDGGRVGIGTPAPSEKLSVAGGIQASVGGTIAVNGFASGLSSGEGVVGVTAGFNGVRGEDTAGDGNGVYGKSVSNNTLYGAVKGENTGSGNGVLGTSANGIGVFGVSTNGYAGVFNGKVRINGNLHVEGNLTKQSGSFRIDHPLDPAHKYLQHSFVESPDMMNVYNGNIVTDGRGFATVRLPRWFQALNRDFRYQLTIVGTRGWQARVVREIANNRFGIQTDLPRVKVSWQVTGIRHDSWANAHRIRVEVAKPAAEGAQLP
jgi:hypothetical protein